MTDLYSVVLHATVHGCAFSVSERDLDINLDALEAQQELDDRQLELSV